MYHFTSYFHDQITTASTVYRIKRPDGTTWSTWSHAPNNNYRASYWWWNRTIPSTEPSGTWTFEATLNGTTVVRDVEVGDPNICPDSYSSADGNPLSGNQNMSADYETDGIIESTQVMTSASTIIEYDSGTTICLDPGFEVVNGVEFFAFIDGCGGNQ